MSFREGVSEMDSALLDELGDEVEIEGIRCGQRRPVG